MIYLKALAGTMFLMVILSVFTEGMIWVMLDLFHASKAVIISGEVLGLIPLAIAFVFIYKTALSAEREILSQENAA
ncbi:hypothetical protein [Fretibacter rubidus]|uniref:hypothetical protein n=1 Tax=Fretibacter rubidus TaxID=570162 RepID=UPI00352B081B